MFPCSRLSRVGTWALLAAGAAAAQPAPPPAPVPEPFAFRSALEQYQPYAPQPVGSWRGANDTVGRIGGWRAYAREAAASEAAAPAVAAPAVAAPPPAADAHGGHGHAPGTPR